MWIRGQHFFFHAWLPAPLKQAILILPLALQAYQRYAQAHGSQPPQKNAQEQEHTNQTLGWRERETTGARASRLRFWATFDLFNIGVSEFTFQNFENSFVYYRGRAGLSAAVDVHKFTIRIRKLLMRMQWIFGDIKNRQTVDFSLLYLYSNWKEKLVLTPSAHKTVGCFCVPFLWTESVKKDLSILTTWRHSRKTGNITCKVLFFACFNTLFLMFYLNFSLGCVTVTLELCVVFAATYLGHVSLEKRGF